MRAKVLRFFWSKSQKDFVVYWPDYAFNGRLVMSVICNKLMTFNNQFEDSLVEQLEKRGYDTTTLKFSIQKRKSQEDRSLNSPLPTSEKVKEGV